MCTDDDALSLRAELSESSVGSRLGLSVSSLHLELENTGEHSIEVPQPGLALLLSLRIVLTREGHGIVRATGIGEPVPLSMQSLAPGETLKIEISPLEDGPRESWLAPGTYDASICVIPPEELAQPSPFAERFGGKCSNSLELVVREVGEEPATG